MYVSCARAETGFNRRQWNCPYHSKCDCLIALAVKEYKDRYELLRSVAHDRSSHAQSKGILSVKQRNAVINAVELAPLAAGSAVQSNLENFSPGKRVASDQRSREAVDRLVSKSRRELMAKRIPGIELDGSEGSMAQLAESLSEKIH